MEKFYNYVQGAMFFIFTSCAAFLDSTFGYLIALLLGFSFNILAGFRADEVKLTLHRIFPPIVVFKNFKGNKFKDSLLELFLITFITYLLKGVIDLMDYDDKSVYVVQWLFAIAIYYYFRNGLRNLVKVYHKVKFLRLVYYLIAFKLKEIIGSDLSDIVEKAEKEQEK